MDAKTFFRFAYECMKIVKSLPGWARNPVGKGWVFLWELSGQWGKGWSTLVALVLLLMDCMDSQKIQLRKMYAKNKNKNWKRQEGPEDQEKIVKKPGKKGIVHIRTVARKKMAQLGTSFLPASSQLLSQHFYATDRRDNLKQTTYVGRSDQHVTSLGVAHCEFGLKLPFHMFPVLCNMLCSPSQRSRALHVYHQETILIHIRDSWMQTYIIYTYLSYKWVNHTLPFRRATLFSERHSYTVRSWFYIHLLQIC